MKKLLYIFILCLFVSVYGLMLRFGSCASATFFDIGQGDSFLIQSGDLKTQILVDGGPTFTLLDELGISMPPWDKTIELVVLTHPHADHLVGLAHVLERFNVKEVFITGISYPSPQYGAFMRNLNQYNIPVTHVNRGTSWEENDLSLKIISPDHIYLGHISPPNNINNSSIGGIIEFNGVKLLFTGDAEEEQESELLQHNDNLQADIMQAGHHGSRTSNSPALIQRVTPRYVVIQSGLDNSFKHPHSESLNTFMDVGTQIWRNDVQGQIRFNSCEAGVISRIRSDNGRKKYFLSLDKIF